MANKFPFEEVQQRFKAAIPVALNAMGNDAINFILDNFKRQGFQGASFQPWAKRKKDTNKTKGKPILISAGHLRTAWRFSKNEAGKSVVISNSMPYAKIHNEGGEIHHPERKQVLHFKNYKSGKNKGFTQFAKPQYATYAKKVNVGSHVTIMPRRQMMGSSPVLNKQVMATLSNTFSKALNTQ